jgi:hypothetical protein
MTSTSSVGHESTPFGQRKIWRTVGLSRFVPSMYGVAAALLVLAVLLFVFASVAALPRMAHAADTAAWGLRFGISSDPDQVLLGAHIKTGYVAPSLQFVPSATIGFGDNYTVIQGNADLHYNLDLEGTAWGLYAGGGFGLAFANYHYRGFDDSSTNAGISVLFGAEAPRSRGGAQFFVEGRAGFVDLPDIEILAGFTFH